MGQKTHPTGFRTGVNKTHNAIWFANYGAYSEVLKEDYKIRKFFEKKFESLYSKAGIRIKVLQVAMSENESSLVARSIADQLEKRVAFRKAIRQTTQMLQKSGVKGFKIQVAGRLNGAEIARAEWAREGRVPLQTLRADISYATHRANTVYGVLGIKVWIFSKEIY